MIMEPQFYAIARVAGITPQYLKLIVAEMAVNLAMPGVYHTRGERLTTWKPLKVAGQKYSLNGFPGSADKGKTGTQ